MLLVMFSSCGIQYGTRNVMLTEYLITITPQVVASAKEDWIFESINGKEKKFIDIFKGKQMIHTNLSIRVGADE